MSRWAPTGVGGQVAGNLPLDLVLKRLCRKQCEAIIQQHLDPTGATELYEMPGEGILLLPSAVLVHFTGQDAPFGGPGEYASVLRLSALLEVELAYDSAANLTHQPGVAVNVKYSHEEGALKVVMDIDLSHGLSVGAVSQRISDFCAAVEVLSCEPSGLIH